MNVAKTTVMRISREPSLLQVMIDQKQREDVEYFKYLSSVVINGAICTREIKSKSKSSILQEEKFSPAD